MDELSEDKSFGVEQNDKFENKIVDDAKVLSHLSESNCNDKDFNNIIKDPMVTKLLDDFNFEGILNNFVRKAGTDDLVTVVEKHFATYVPICLSMTDNPTINIIDTKSVEVLIKPLEAFICNNTNTDSVIKKIKELDEPPKLCGKLFNVDESTYYCQDCGTDPTCVLCSTCFLNSEHRYHSYKVMKSYGVKGYCDCGDLEAWKQQPSCQIHSKNGSSKNESPEALIKRLDKDLVQRAKQLFQYLFEYISELLCNNHLKDVPSHLKPIKETDDYVLMVINDEIHGHEQVANILKKVLNLDDKKALEYATVIDEEGRSVIKRNKKTECELIKANIEKFMAADNNTPLATRVIHSALASHQYFTERIIVWLKTFANNSKTFKHILCEIGFKSYAENPSIVEKLMLNDYLFWKSAKCNLHQFFISIYFLDENWKKEFSILFSNIYQLIWRNYLKNPVDKVSVIDLSVQLFTVNSLSKHLMRNQNLLQIIIDTLIEQSQSNLYDQGKLHFSRSNNTKAQEFNRAQFIIFDVKFALNTVPDTWDDQLRKNFLNGFKALIEFLGFMQGMDKTKRFITENIESEPEWETAYNLLIKLHGPLSSLVEWCASDQYVLVEAITYLLKRICEIEKNNPMFKYCYEKTRVFYKSYKIIKYDMSVEEVSIHAPLTRLLAALNVKLAKYNKTISDIINSKLPRNSVKLSALIEPALRAQVLVTQTNAGLWKNNGRSILAQVYYYNNIRCRVEMFDKDILALQMGAALMDPNEFLAILLNRFGLDDFWDDGDMKLKNLLLISEDFLQLIITLVSERYEPMIGKVEPNEKLKREVIHQLCVSPMTHSDIVANTIPKNEADSTTDLDNILSEVAVFKSGSSETAQGTYELKIVYQNQYNPYYYHYTKIEQAKSEEEQLKRKSQPSEKFFPPPVPPQFQTNFANIRNILDSDILIEILTCVLKMSNNQSKAYSNGQLMKALHLIGLALLEEKADKETNGKRKSLKFVEKVQKQKQDECLKSQLVQLIPKLSTGQCKLLATWTLDLFNKVVAISTIESFSETVYFQLTPNTLFEMQFIIGILCFIEIAFIFLFV